MDRAFTFIRMLTALLLVVGGVALAQTPTAPDRPRTKVLVVDVTGVIGVATTLHIQKAVEQARNENAEVLILRIDTPGGLVSSTREIVQAILGSQVPVVGFVAPSGAHAASAGTYIMAATHIAAMAPGTQIGAATPISLGAPSTPSNPLAPAKEDDAKKDKETKDATDTNAAALDRKSLNDAVSFIKSLAQMRGRNAEWMEKAVRDAATLTGDEAQRERVVEIVANDIPDLLTKLEGRSVTIAGVERKLAVKDLPIGHVEPGWRTTLLSAIADPNIAFILLMIGVYGIMFEFWNPGSVAPGVIGGICLLLAMTALTALPVSYAGFALLLFGIALMVAEHFAVGFGVLGFGGVVAFVIGALFLFDPAGSDVDVAIAWPVIAGFALTTFLLMSVIVGFAIRARQRPAMAGGEELIGAQGDVVEWQGGAGTVRLRGEIWSANSEGSFNPGDRVSVVDRRGLVLTVRPATQA